MEKKIPHEIQLALDEYQKLCMEGCLVIPCKECRYLVRINEDRSTCKRERLMAMLWDKYREEVKRIDAFVSGKAV